MFDPMVIARACHKSVPINMCINGKRWTTVFLIAQRTRIVYTVTQAFIHRDMNSCAGKIFRSFSHMCLNLQMVRERTYNVNHVIRILSRPALPVLLYSEVSTTGHFAQEKGVMRTQDWYAYIRIRPMKIWD